MHVLVVGRARTGNIGGYSKAFRRVCVWTAAHPLCPVSCSCRSSSPSSSAGGRGRSPSPSLIPASTWRQLPWRWSLCRCVLFLKPESTLSTCSNTRTPPRRAGRAGSHLLQPSAACCPADGHVRRIGGCALRSSAPSRSCAAVYKFGIAAGHADWVFAATS